MNNYTNSFYWSIMILLLSSLTSCVAPKDLTYFQLQEGQEYKKIQSINNAINLNIQAGDELVINVNGLDPEVALPFNINTQPQTQQQIIGYQVDQAGMINFPVIGKIKAAGRTIDELNHSLTDSIRLHINEPVVNIRFANLRVTVLGEVNQPGVISTNNNKISLLEALGQAGDINDFGNRSNVLLIREQNGNREQVYIDLLTTDIFTSPYYYLRQNDVIYVEPTKRKSTSLTSQQTSQILSIVTSITSVAALIFALTK